MPDREGQRLGNYRLVRLLGKGAFAEVYLGEHLYLNNYAAIKVLLTSLTEKDEQVFLSEAKTLAQLAHPNIVRVHDFAIERDLPFLVMDYAPGGTLRQRYPKGMCLSLDQTVTYIKQVATALQYAHNHGIIHRDVKPENVLQGPQQVMLSDFGISLHLPSVQPSDSQEWAGTLPYIAPEQLRGKAVYASDQYSLAIVAYEWLCGVCPFEGNSLSLAYQHAQVPPPPLREKDPSLPAAVEKVILKALSKDPRDRYASVITFARVLERVSRESIHEQVQNWQTDASDPQQRSTPQRVFLSHSLTDNVSRLKTDLETRETIVTDLTSSTQAQPDSASADNAGTPNNAGAHSAGVLDNAGARLISPVPITNAGTPDNAGARLISPGPAYNTISPSHEEAARQAIRAAQLVLLVISPQTRSSIEVKEHLRIAGIYRRPVLCIWASGQELPQLLPAGTEQSPVIDSRGPRYSQALDEIMTHLDRERRGSPISERLAPEPTFEPRNPYKGLHAFTLQDRRDFFGREAFIKEMITLLRDTLLPATSGSPGKRLLTIVGPSGSGKSSIAMAGLLPQLQDSAIEGSDSWIYLDPLLPGKQPLDTLASILTARFPEKGIQAVREVLARENAFGLHQLALATAHQGTRVVLLIDQFEELFSPGVSEAERQHFINLLVTAATEPRGPVLLILTLRADFYDRPLAYPALGQLIQQGQSTVLPMELEDIRAVIERPALQSDVRLVFEEDLVGDLLYEIGGQPAALPLLEFTLDQLFSHRRGHRLTRHAYQEIGGVRGALSKHAEDTYARLPSEEHRRLTRAVFMRLIQPAATGQDPIRRRANQAEFTSENEQHTRALNEVIMAFLAARLLTINQISGVTTLEVSHEALLREWPRLAEWVHSATEDIRLQQTISSDVAEWEQRGHPKDRLYRGTQLKESLTWLQRNIASGSEAAFLRASTTRRKRERISLLVVACLILALLIPAGLLARQQLTPPTVTSLQDSGPGSLRQVIEAAPQGSTIYFAPNLKGHISLGSALEISRNLTIRGPGANLLSIGGIGSIYLILIDAGANVTFSGLTFSEPKPRIGGMINNSGSLTLDQCTIANNTELGDKLPNLPNENQAVAAGIDNTGTLTLQSSIITKNTITTGTGIGGGISNDKGTVTLIKSQITDNTVKSSGQLAGGGALVNTGGKVMITSSNISGNTVTGGTIGTAGGAIYSSQGTLLLIGSTVANNSVSNSTAAGLGAGILGDGSTITLTNSRVTDNKVTARGIVSGGGIEIDDGSLKLISSIVLQNSANSSNDSGLGGGINASKSTVMLTNSQVSNNTVTGNKLAGGGGIASTGSPGSITLDGSTITNNTITAPGVGGGGIISLDGKVTITNSTVSNNTARGTQGDNGGGGIFDTDTLTITNSIISHNTLTSTSTSLGGGIASAGILNLSNSTVSDNTINNSNGISNGAGIAIQKPLDPKITGDTMKLTNCTISENKASGSKGSYGGGIEAEGVQGTIDFCTVYGNTAATAAGGFASGLDPKWGKPSITLKNTLIANNSAASGPDLMGTITTGGYNLVQRFSGATWNDPANKHATDLSGDKYPNLGIDPQLRASGKATPTHALLPNSPALNQIPPASCDIPVDQRGVKRPQQNACDIGAYEYTP